MMLKRSMGAGDSFGSINDLATRHADLLERQSMTREIKDDSFSADLLRFVEDVRDYGEVTYSFQMRNALQSFLDYWYTELIKLDEWSAQDDAPLLIKEANPEKGEGLYELESQAADWVQQGRREDDLLSGAALASAARHADNSYYLKELVHASRQHNRRTQFIVAALAFGVTALAFSYYSVQKENREQAKINEMLAERTEEQREIIDQQGAFLRERMVSASSFYEEIKAVSNGGRARPADKALLKAEKITEKWVASEIEEIRTAASTAAAWKRAVEEAYAETVGKESEEISAETFSELEQIAQVEKPTRVSSARGYCSGAIWIGSKDAQKLQDAPSIGDAKMSGADLWIGKTFTVGTNLRLRAGKPNNQVDYVHEPTIGIVKSGARVTARSTPVGYKRASGRQYWLDVDVPLKSCATIYLQYAGNGDRFAKSLTAMLDKDGYFMPGIEKLASAKGRSEVRYFNEADKALANLVVADVEAALRASNYTPPNGGDVSVKLQDLSDGPLGGAVSENTVEIWLDLSSARNRAPAD